MYLRVFVRSVLLIQIWCLGFVVGPLDGFAEEPVAQIAVITDRGPDLGDSFGSLFEVETKDGSLVIGAGFQNAYNTRYRADRHSVQFFVRPTDSKRIVTSESLPRPNNLCGTYLYGRDEIVYSTYGGLRSWTPATDRWNEQTAIGGTDETMRLGDGVLSFGDSSVKYNDRVILDPPSAGSYQLFFYARGHLCFYHIDRHDGGYRPYASDDDGFSKLVACPWTPKEATVDLSKAVEMTLPIVGETTFAWGQIGKQIVTGSNIGGFYVFTESRWRMLLEPKLDVSYQLYSTMSFHDRLLMGQYPTGRLFQYDGMQIQDIAGWPPQLDGVSAAAREAQTTAIYGGELFVGVWPWGELWQYNSGSKQWSFARRMFDHPELSDQVTHPYDVENQGNEVGNRWGQRITSLVTAGPNLLVSTSAKAPCDWDADRYPFLGPDKWKSYGSVYQLMMPGHLGAATVWTDGRTTFEFTITRDAMQVHQDGKLLSSASLSSTMKQQLDSLNSLKEIRWGTGIYGAFGGKRISGSMK